MEINQNKEGKNITHTHTHTQPSFCLLFSISWVLIWFLSTFSSLTTFLLFYYFVPSPILKRLLSWFNFLNCRCVIKAIVLKVTQFLGGLIMCKSMCLWHFSNKVGINKWTSMLINSWHTHHGLEGGKKLG